MNFSRHPHQSKHTCFAVVVLALVVAAALAIHTGTTHAKKPKPATLIKFATLAPEGSTWMKVMHAIDDEVRVATENRVGFKFYPGGVQGDEKDVLRKIRNGQVHGGGFTGFGLGAVASEFRVIELPFMFKDYAEVDYVRGELDPYFTQVFADKGYEFLGWGDVGFVYLFSNTPIRSPEELQRSKMWTWSGDALAEIFFSAFDVSPIPLALPDVLTSLQMGVIDAVYNAPLGCIALQWFTRVKYMTDVPVTYGFGALLVSKKSLKKVDPADLETLKTICRRHTEGLIGKTRTSNAEAINEIKVEGVDILKVDAQVEKAFFVKGRDAWTDGIGKLYPEDLLKRVTALVDGYRANPKEAKNTP